MQLSIVVCLSFVCFLALSHAGSIPELTSGAALCSIDKYYCLSSTTGGSSTYVAPYTYQEYGNRNIIIANSTGNYVIIRNMRLNQNLGWTSGTTAAFANPSTSLGQKWLFTVFNTFSDATYTIRNELGNCYLRKASDTTVSCIATLPNPPLPTYLWRFVDQNVQEDVYY